MSYFLLQCITFFYIAHVSEIMLYSFLFVSDLFHLALCPLGTETWKGAEYHRSKPQWNITSHPLGCQLSKGHETTSADKDVKKREPLCTVCGAATMENIMEVPQKIKNRATIWFSNHSSGYIPKRNEITISKRHLHFHVHCTIIQNSPDMETT